MNGFFLLYCLALPGLVALMLRMNKTNEDLRHKVAELESKLAHVSKPRFRP